MQHKIKKMNDNTYYTKKKKREKRGNPSSTYILDSSKYLKFNLNIPAYISITCHLLLLSVIFSVSKPISHLFIIISRLEQVVVTDLEKG